MMTGPKLHELAARITIHLKRMEVAQADISPWADYWKPRAWAAGNRVGISYVLHYADQTMTKAEAAAYLAWLDAGNSGKHFAMKEIAT